MRTLLLNDLAIAHQLAKTGSLTATGLALNTTHSTVARRINALEQELGVTLFIHNQRGYSPSQAGRILLQQMPAIEASLDKMLDEISSEDKEVAGNLKISTLSGYSRLLSPSIKLLRKEYPGLRIFVDVTDQIIPLDSGAVHLSLRAGPQPQEADVIAQKVMDLNNGYYAAPSYVEKYGLPSHVNEFNQHYWAMPTPEYARVPFVGTVLEQLDPNQIIYQSNHFPDLFEVIRDGLAIGPLESIHADTEPTLARVNLDLDKRKDALWLVYHRDLKHNKRVRAFANALHRTLEIGSANQ